MPEPEQRKIEIKVRGEDLKGHYSNLMQVVHTKDEFILDFFLVSAPQGILNSRIIMSPGHLKRMAKALQQNVEKYEEKFGEIKMTELLKRKLGFTPEDK